MRRGGSGLVHVSVFLSPESERGRYLIACARIRNVTLSRLVNTMIGRAADDQLVRAILDDEDEMPRKPAFRPKWTRSFREVA